MSVDDKVYAVLQPVDAEQDEVGIRIRVVWVHDVGDGDRSHEEEIAEADQEKGPGQAKISALYGVSRGLLFVEKINLSCG